MLKYNYLTILIYVDSEEEVSSEDEVQSDGEEYTVEAILDKRRGENVGLNFYNWL